MTGMLYCRRVAGGLILSWGGGCQVVGNLNKTFQNELHIYKHKFAFSTFKNQELQITHKGKYYCENRN